MRSPDDPQLQEAIKQEAIQFFKESRNDIHRAARRQIARIQNENSRQFYRQRREAIRYKESSIVAIKRTQQGTGLKLAIKCMGPYKIIKCNGNESYKVEKTRDREGTTRNTTTAKNIKPWRDFRDDLEEDLESDQKDDEAESQPDSQE